MEHHYARLKRSTLKDLLEARGKVSSNKSKATLITELMEIDQASNPPADTSEATEFQRDVQWRLALYGTHPPQEVISQVLREVSQLRMAELQRDQGASVMFNREAPAARKKLPYAAFRMFQDGEDEMDVYLQMFERQCGLQGVNKADWVTLLVSRLTGRAAEAYNNVPDEISQDYDRVKERLLARFGITPEAHRLRFRNLRRKEREPYTEWAHQMTRAAESWMTGRQAVTMADALQLILLEQFYDHTPHEVRDWVKDRRPVTVDEAATLADQYVDSRRTVQPEPKTPARPVPNIPRSVAPPHQPSIPGPTQLPSSRGKGDLCYRCNQAGHVRRYCPQNVSQDARNNRPLGPAWAAAHCLERNDVTYPSEENIGILHEADPVQAAAMDNRLHH